MADAFFLPEEPGPAGARFTSTALTRGPWDNRFQHGGPPAALLAGALDAWGEDASDWFLSRLSVELLRPVPLAPVEVRVRADKLGRTVQRLTAELWSGERLVLAAVGLRTRRRDLGDPGQSEVPASLWPEPAGCLPLHFDFFRHEVGYHRAIELRLAHGAWGTTPIGVWTRPTVPLVAGRPTSAVERLVILADAQSGMGVPLDPQRWSFVNPDMHVFFGRDPVGDWLGFDIESTSGGHGSGLAQSAVRDARGIVARSIQTLVVGPRTG